MPERSVFLVDNPVRDYAWGSTTAIPAALGVPATGRPQAELWMGAHPSAPSRVVATGRRLDEHLAAHPELLGSVAGAELPFLMKLLAADQPLSLQVHPTRPQAEAGYAREQAAGVPLDDPRRSYKDRSHKPEIIVAMTPFKALCGFQHPQRARAQLVDLLGKPTVGVHRRLLAALALPDETLALKEAFTLILTAGAGVRAVSAAAVDAAQHADGPLADTLRTVGRHFGDDPGVLAATLLNRVDLAPGEALFLDAGHVHAYLDGLGVESMVPSDNVLRGGLTPKHIDVPELLAVVRFQPLDPHHIVPVAHELDGVAITSYWTPAHEFAVHRIDVHGARTISELEGPTIVLTTEGTIRVGAGDDALELPRGAAAFVAAGLPIEVRGDGVAYATTSGQPHRQHGGE